MSRPPDPRVLTIRALLLFPWRRPRRPVPLGGVSDAPFPLAADGQRLCPSGRVANGPLRGPVPRTRLAHGTAPDAEWVLGKLLDFSDPNRTSLHRKPPERTPNPGARGHRGPRTPSPSP